LATHVPGPLAIPDLRSEGDGRIEPGVAITGDQLIVPKQQPDLPALLIVLPLGGGVPEGIGIFLGRDGSDAGVNSQQLVAIGQGIDAVAGKGKQRQIQLAPYEPVQAG
jgi:hypothetical protein